MKCFQLSVCVKTFPSEMLTQIKKLGQEELDKGGQKAQISIYKVSTRDVMYNMMTPAKNAAGSIGKLLRE